jgi:hypothetical protein
MRNVKSKSTRGNIFTTVSTYVIFFITFLVCHQAFGQKFDIVTPGTKAGIVYDTECTLDSIAANLLADDIERISGYRPMVSADISRANGNVIVVGSITSKTLDQFRSKINLDSLKGKWESYGFRILKSPSKKIKNALLITGSDFRGTAYGVFSLSARLGVSPWYWWADVVPVQRKSLSVNMNDFTSEPPSVKYRGIFLNDEDWGLQPWAAKTFEPETKDIGPKTYGKIFELLLRLKANTIWPAMHHCTKAFYSIPGNKEMAAKYQIFIGTSHAEPMLRNNVGEWNQKLFGEYNYATNSKVVKEYWQNRIKELDSDDNYIVTVGMRGIHDSGMQGNFTKEEKVNLLQTIITDQRKMLGAILKKDATTIPQAFVPYKEVLEVYSDGAKVPDDVTLVWPDDNQAYIRQLSDANERKRSGGAGVYYHISYWGRPHDFLWLESVPVSLIWEEMNKAYQTNAKDIWIANVGDIKPIEVGMNFFLDMAWNQKQFSPENISSYYTRFAGEQFGEAYGKEIGDILTSYFQLAFSRKPEHMGWSQIYPNTPIKDPELSLFNYGDEVQNRIDAYTKLEEQVTIMQNKLPEHLKNAFFQLVGYKVLGASYMNKKILYSYKSRVYASQGRVSANLYAEKAKRAFEDINKITEEYNRLNNGKWMYMMTYNPRNLPVFGMPEVGHVEPNQQSAAGIAIEGLSQPVLAGNESPLPTFLSSTSRKYFIDVFNVGKEKIKWVAKAKDPWVRLSSVEGETTGDERIWVSVDWSRVPINQTVNSTIEVNVASIIYQVKLTAQRSSSASDDSHLFVEDNGIVSIEAEHFTKSKDVGNNQWKAIQGLGRQNDAMGTFPLTALPLNVTSDQAPSLSYDFSTQSNGPAIVRFYVLPSQPINGDYKLRFGLSVDDGEHVFMNSALKETMDEHNDEWKINALRASNIIQSKAISLQPGKHQLKITMIDPGVVIDKIEIVLPAGEKLISYFGAPESRANSDQ